MKKDRREIGGLDLCKPHGLTTNKRGGILELPIFEEDGLCSTNCLAMSAEN